MQEQKKTEIDLRPVWCALLDVYASFKTLCEKHHLRYWAAYGTVLGAVRHKGFIPWDDDLDVCMLREDYEKFLRVAVEELPKHLKIVTYKNTPEFCYNIFAKIQDNRKEVLDAVSKISGMSLRGGLFIDVFPLEGCPTGAISRLRYDFGKIFLRMIYDDLYTVRKNNESFRLRIYLRVCKLVARLFKCIIGDRISYLRHCECMVLKHPPQRSRFVGRCAPELGGLKRRKPINWFDGAVFLDFCGIKMPCPLETDKYLSMIYGDYMRLPPIEKRCVVHAAGLPCPWRLGPTTEKLPF